MHIVEWKKTFRRGFFFVIVDIQMLFFLLGLILFSSYSSSFIISAFSESENYNNHCNYSITQTINLYDGENKKM